MVIHVYERERERDVRNCFIYYRVEKFMDLTHSGLVLGACNIEVVALILSGCYVYIH